MTEGIGGGGRGAWEDDPHAQTGSADDQILTDAISAGPWSWHKCFDPTGKRLTSLDIANGHSLTGVAVLASVWGNEANARLITAAPELCASVEETHAWIRRIQDTITGYLVPDGYDADEALARLIEMLDGPEQREIQGRAFAAIAKVRGEAA